MWITKYIDFMSILTIAVIFIPVERLIPLRREQGLLRRDFYNDLFYLFFNRIPILIATSFVVATGLTMLRDAMPAGIGETVRAQPLWLQTIEVILLADAGFYFAHRLLHAVPFLWRFHAVHHSIEQMDWLAAHRVHPLDQIAVTLASVTPVFLLGFSDTAVLVYAVIYQWQSLLIHANIRMDFGPLKWIFASPQFHHWHHANQPEAYDKNLAGQLVLFDILFGTLFLPRDQRHPDRYGTDDPVPRLYHQQLLYPFTKPVDPAQNTETTGQNAHE